MYFASLHALLVMEGHGVYVWTAYLVTLLVIALTLLLPLRRSRRLLQQSALEARRAQGPTGNDQLHQGAR
jgi:heme exporter protein D